MNSNQEFLGMQEQAHLELMYHNAVYLWKFVYSKQLMLCGWRSLEEFHTEDGRDRSWDVFGYFHTDSDNDDVLYILIQKLFPHLNTNCTNKVYFFAEMIRDQFEAYVQATYKDELNVGGFYRDSTEEYKMNVTHCYSIVRELLRDRLYDQPQL